MSVWTTRASGTTREYIVIQHRLPNIDYTIQGIKFRSGYAVVEKSSKAYYLLKKTPLLKEAKEYPLIHLKNLAFITRTSDVKTIFGQDVYVHYLKQLNEFLDKIEQEKQVKIEEQQKIDELSQCKYILKEGCHCKNQMLEVSPSGFCKMHILEEPKLAELGITIPRLTKEERDKFRDKVVGLLAKAKKEGKF